MASPNGPLLKFRKGRYDFERDWKACRNGSLVLVWLDNILDLLAAVGKLEGVVRFFTEVLGWG